MIFSIIILLISSASVSAIENNTVSGPVADYYILALSRCAYGDPFGIHGLWPQWNLTSWPEYCNMSDPLHISEIKSLLPRLQKHWFSCDGNDTWFWEHEWLKHGTCAVFSPFVYFISALNYFRDLPISLFCKRDELECLIPTDMIG